VSQKSDVQQNITQSQSSIRNASTLVQQSGVTINSFRIDKYFSNQADIEYCKDHLSCSKVYFIPKSNVTVRGSKE